MKWPLMWKKTHEGEVRYLRDKLWSYAALLNAQEDRHEIQIVAITEAMGQALIDQNKQHVDTIRYRNAQHDEEICRLEKQIDDGLKPLIQRLARISLEYVRDHVYHLDVQFDAHMLMGLRVEDHRKWIAKHFARYVEDRLLNAHFVEPPTQRAQSHFEPRDDQ